VVSKAITAYYLQQRMAAIHNPKQSRIVQLPDELLLEIGAHLWPLHTIAIHQTCQKLRSVLLLGRGVFPLNEFDPEISVLEDAAFFRSDHSRASLQARKWCSACKFRHPAYHFSTEQRQHDPLARRCIIVRVCDHHSFTHTEIQAMAPGRYRGRSDVLDARISTVMPLTSISLTTKSVTICLAVGLQPPACHNEATKPIDVTRNADLSKGPTSTKLN
jgi:hypothetical protein